MNALHAPNHFGFYGAKLASVSALLLLLALVCYMAIWNRGAAAPSTGLPLANPPLTSSPKPPAATSIDRAHWPHLSLQEIIASDVFRPWPTVEPRSKVAAAAAKGSVERGHATLSEGSAIRPADTASTTFSGTLQAVFHDRSGAAAIMGSRVVRPGDILAGGARVVAVTSDGIVVETK